MRRLRTDPVVGDVVRARLDALVAEISGAPPVAGLSPEVVGPGGVDAGGSEGGHAGGPEGADAGGRASPKIAPAWVGRAWAFTRAHVAVLGVVGLVALIGAVWTLTQARTVPVAVAAPTPVSTSVTPTPTPTPEPVRVHVLGAVASPGVVSLVPGARVEDAISAAGGFTPSARPGELNLAALVADGAQVFVGDASDPGGEVRGSGDGGAGGAAGGGTAGGAAAGGGGGGKIDLNRATQEQLDALPGVGPGTAQAILAWRSENRRFSRVEELQEVDGIGPKTYAQLAPLVRV